MIGETVTVHEDGTTSEPLRSFTPEELAQMVRVEDASPQGPQVIRAVDDGKEPAQTIDELCADFRKQLHKISQQTELPVLDPVMVLFMSQVVERLDKLVQLAEVTLVVKR